MNSFRKLTKYVIAEDDFLFLLKTSPISIKPFFAAASQYLHIEAYQGLLENYPLNTKPRMILGNSRFWTQLIYPQLDQNPLFLFILQDPTAHILENFGFVSQKNAQSQLTLEEFLSDPQFSPFVNNPQWNQLLNINLCWAEKQQIQHLSDVAKNKLIAERLEQAAYVGISERPWLSFNLFQYTFSGMIDPDVDYPKLTSKAQVTASISPKIRTLIQKKTNRDRVLYNYATELFYDRINQMMQRLAQETPTKMPDPGVIVLPPEMNFTSSELQVIHLFRKLRNKLFPKDKFHTALIKRVAQKLKPQTQPDPMDHNQSERKKSALAQKKSELIFSVFLSTCDETPADIAKTLDSLIFQTADNWDMILVTDQASGPAIPNINRQNIKIVDKEAESADLLEYAKGDYIFFLRPGQELIPEAISIIEEKIASSAFSHDVVYFDELVIDSENTQQPFFKPGKQSPEMLLSTNYLDTACYHKNYLKTWQNNQETKNNLPLSENQSWKLALFSGYSQKTNFVHIPDILILNPARYIHPQPDSIGELKAHLISMGLQNPQAELLPSNAVRVGWDIKNPLLISIIIPTHNNFDFIKKCVDSIGKFTIYPDYEIILVDNQSTDKKVLDFYATLINKPNIKIVPYDQEFNYSEANNLGAEAAEGDLYLFLNNDIEITHQGWLTELATWLEISGIGIAGPKLLYSDGTIQSFGTVIGLQGHAGHIFAGMQENSKTIYGSTIWYRNFSAVTGACLLTKKKIFKEIGGFNLNYQIAFGDVDFCLKAIQHGYRIVSTPFSVLTHYEGKTRSSHVPQNDVLFGLKDLKPLFLTGDPYFNPQLSLASTAPGIRITNELTPIERIAQTVIFNYDAGNLLK